MLSTSAISLSMSDGHFPHQMPTFIYSVAQTSTSMPKKSTVLRFRPVLGHDPRPCNTDRNFVGTFSVCSPRKWCSMTQPRIYTLEPSAAQDCHQWLDQAVPRLHRVMVSSGSAPASTGLLDMTCRLSPVSVTEISIHARNRRFKRLRIGTGCDQRRVLKQEKGQ